MTHPVTGVETICCPLCGEEDSKVLYPVIDKALYHPVDKFWVVRCRRCGLVYVNPRPSSETKSVFYQGGYVFDADSDPVPIGHYRAVIEQLTSDGRRGSVLDVGTGNSLFLPVMRDRGWQVAGTEINEKLVEHFHSCYGIDLFLGQLEDADFAECSFDAVSMFGVLEHVPDPRSLIREVRRILKDDGVFCLNVFNRSVESRMLGRYWLGFDPPRQLYSFSVKTLGEMLAREGFQLSSISYPRITYVPYSLVWFAKRISNRLRARKGPTIVQKLPAALDLISRPLAALLAKTGSSSHIYIFARKAKDNHVHYQ